MCKFLSLLSNGKGDIYYLDAKQREETKEKYESPDSHTAIADYYGFKGEKEDVLNKWEYNPLTKILSTDQINTFDDCKIVLKKCKSINFKTITPELIIKPISNPIKKRVRVTKEDVSLLKQWISVWTSVGDSVWDSVGNSVWTSVGDSVWISVWDSVWNSVWDSVKCYISSFFDIQYEHDFSPCIKLWEKGLVPSFDGKTWRLHGYKGKILWENKGGEIK